MMPCSRACGCERVASKHVSLRAFLCVSRDFATGPAAWQRRASSRRVRRLLAARNGVDASVGQEVCHPERRTAAESGHPGWVHVEIRVRVVQKVVDEHLADDAAADWPEVLTRRHQLRLPQYVVKEWRGLEQRVVELRQVVEIGL